MTLYPDDARVPEAQKIIASLKTEQARGNFTIGQYHESHGKWVFRQNLLQRSREPPAGRTEFALRRSRPASVSKR